MVEENKSKIITVSILLDDIYNDTFFFQVPGEVSDSKDILDVALQKYSTDVGILEGFIADRRIVLQWYPENVNADAENLHKQALEMAKKKEFEAAIARWEEAIGLNDEDVEYLYKVGLVFFEKKEYQNAIQLLEKAVKICPIHFRAYILMGICWIKLRKFDVAETHVLASNRLNHSNILTHLNLGVIYSVQKRFNEAIEAFNSTIHLSPTESRAYLGLARIYVILNDMDTANRYFRKVIELVPGTRIAEFAKRSITVSQQQSSGEGKKETRENLFSEGMGHFLSGEYQLAGKKYKEYLSDHPSDDYAWYLLGESKLRTGELEESADCFKRAIKLNSNRGLYYKSLSIALHFQGKSGEVVEVIKKALEMGKKDSLCLTLYGINLHRERRVEEAIHSFQHTLKNNPNNPLALYNLALAYIQTQSLEQAEKLLKSILGFEYYIPLKDQAKNLLNTMNT